MLVKVAPKPAHRLLEVVGREAKLVLVMLVLADQLLCIGEFFVLRCQLLLCAGESLLELSHRCRMGICSGCASCACLLKLCLQLGQGVSLCLKL